MEKKTLSKPMKEILTRLEEFEHISTSIFPEVVILNVRAGHLFAIYVMSDDQHNINLCDRSLWRGGRCVTA